MNFLSRQIVCRHLIGRKVRPFVDVQAALFNKSCKLFKETSNKTPAEDENRPIKYFGSEAASWSASQSHYNPNIGNGLWYQPLVISGSLAIFLIYFCILREENDVDVKLSMSLYDRIEGLEVQQLEATLQYNSSHGLPTLDVEKRLKELKEINTD